MTKRQFFTKHLMIIIGLFTLCAMPIMAQDTSDAEAGYAEALRRIDEAAVNGTTNIDLSYLGLKGIPVEIERLGNPETLQSLDLSANQLTVMPPEIAQMTNLMELKLGGNQLTTLPPEIGQLTKLLRLDVSGNQLTSLPPEIWQLPELEYLFLQVNQLTTIPPEIGQLRSLVVLDLSANQLTTIPPEITQLKELWRLDLADNQLTALPPEIGKMDRLNSFTIHGNQLTTLPLEFGQMTLSQATFEDNPLTFPPTDVQAEGPGAIIRYLRDYNSMQLRQGLIAIAVISVIMLGLAFYWRQRRVLLEAKRAL